jgi:hypothetical protein
LAIGDWRLAIGDLRFAIGAIGDFSGSEFTWGAFASATWRARNNRLLP